MSRRRPSSAELRTLSLFTRKTDTEDPNARDGSEPDHTEYLRTKRRVRWKQCGGLHVYEADVLGALIHVERTVAGPWAYRVERRGYTLGIFPTIADAADAAEALR